MKVCFGLILFVVSFSMQAQKPVTSFSTIDWNVQSITAESPDSLATRLTAPYQTELEKVRAVYSWICQHIQYNTSIYRPNPQNIRYTLDPLDTASVWKSGDEMVAQKVLRRGMAVCDGYSRLFKVLCQYAGIEAVVVNGYARSDWDRAAYRFRTNHTWNAVRIDSVWHLLDVTWASGYMDYANNYVQHQNDYYFLAPPEEFIRHHYPEDLRWSLLAQPPTMAEFKKMPFRSKSFIKYDIAAYFPVIGIVEAEVGDTLSFSIQLKDAEKAKRIGSDPFLDTTNFTSSPLSVFIKPEKEKGNKAQYSFVVDTTTEWIHLLYNDDVVLRYRVNRKQDLATN